jgi:hypothetical protein
VAVAAMVAGEAVVVTQMHADAGAEASSPAYR